MVQDTTAEFARRLNQAMEASPHVPPQQHGRVTWLQRELSSRLHVNVSLNTVHKWTTGASRPREDRVRDLARLLKVDEIWLAMGKSPTQTPHDLATQAVKSTGAVLVVAGLIELNGGRVTFSGEGQNHAIRANLAGKEIAILALSPQVSGATVSMVVPEPTNGARVVAVVHGRDVKNGTSHVELLDVTNCKRHHFGGFSVLEMKRTAKGGLEPADGSCSLAFLTSVEELAVG